MLEALKQSTTQGGAHLRARLLFCIVCCVLEVPMQLALKIIRVLLTLPTVLIGWGYVLLLTLVGAAHQWSFDAENLVLNAKWRPWVTKFNKYSVTVSRGIIYHPAHGDDTKAHEMVHVRQGEDAVFLGLLLGAVVAILLAADADPLASFFGFWIAGVAFKAPNWLTALLRGGHAYRDCEHERSAYAQTDKHHVRDGKSWLEVHTSRPRDW